MNRYLIIFAPIICLLLLLSVQGVGLHLAYPQDNDIEQADRKLIEAFIAVKQAESAGARKEELVELVSKLNEGLTLLEMARKGEGETGGISKVIELSDGVISRAKEIEMRASSRLLRFKVLLLFAVPVASVVTAFSLNYAYKWWYRREIEKILRMVAKKKEERTS